MTYFDFLSDTPPWKNAAVDRLGEHFAKGKPFPEEGEAILNWYERLGRETGKAAEAFAQNFFEVNRQSVFIKASDRAKSKLSIAEKRNRDKIKLSRMWDFAGARLTANVLHSDLRQLSAALQDHLAKGGFGAQVKDYLDRPQQGYRAVHVVISSNAGLVELQLRTLMQSEWANAFELLADRTGRRIRYETGYIPSDPVLAEAAENLQIVSENIYRMEVNQEQIAARNVETYKVLAAPIVGLPIASAAHFARAEALEHLRQVELASAKQASATFELLKNLRKLTATFRTLEAVREE